MIEAECQQRFGQRAWGLRTNDKRKVQLRMDNYTVGYLIGSLSVDSMNRTLSKALIRLAPDNLAFQEIAIRDLPLYNRDLDDDYPQAGRALKEAIAAVDALLFVTPEYNRGCRAS